MGRMIDADDWDAINDAVRKHPWYLGGVVWSVHDVKSECEYQNVDYARVEDDLMMIDFNGWEDVAISDGWPVIQEWVSDHAPDDEPVERDGFDEMIDRMMTDSKFHDDIVGWF